MRICSLVGVALATGVITLSACAREAGAEEAPSPTKTASAAPAPADPPAAASGNIRVPMLVAGILFSAGGVGSGIALAATLGSCGSVDDQCAMPAILIAPTLAGVFLGIPMMIAGTTPEESDDDEVASLTPAVVVAPGGLGLSWRF